MTMFTHMAEYTAPEVLTEQELELISGGVTPDANGNLPTCPSIPPWFHGGPISEPQGAIK